MAAVCIKCNFLHLFVVKLLYICGTIDCMHQTGPSWEHSTQRFGLRTITFTKSVMVSNAVSKMRVVLH